MASHERYKLSILEGSLILILSIGCVISKTQKPYTCVIGVTTAGYTYPLGDITLEYGDNLDILCILHENKAAEYGPNASSLMSIKWMDKIQPTDIVNSTTIRLHIENHPKKKSANYACFVNGTFVCHNVVVVGTKPQNVTNFSCIGYNYENLTCTWTAPENYVKTDYHLEYIPSSRPARYKKPKTTKQPTFALGCPNITYTDETKTNLACTWSFSTKPQYRHSHEHYKFRLKANNTFGTMLWEFPFDHWPHVIPNAPEHLTASPTSPHSIRLKWMVPVKMQSFPGGIEHRVSWWIEGNSNWVTLPSVQDEKIERKIMEYDLVDLPYAHWLYDIRVSMKSLKATDENFWSQNSSVTVRTKSKLPERPPKTDIGSFEIPSSSSRIVYWQKIHDYEENGQDFSYDIAVEGYPDIKPNKPIWNYASFNNLTDQNYTFKIWSKNELGLSERYSTVFVPSSTRALKSPQKLVKVDRDHGVYDLEWPISDDPRVTNYTIFWCAGNRKYHCDGTFNWTVVPQGIKNITFKLSDFNKEMLRTNYLFAISTNGYRSSSGMLWAECTIISGRGFKLTQTYVKNNGPRFITVAWQLDCIKMSDLKGFNITYCPLVPSPHSMDCKNNSLKYMLIDKPNIDECKIDDLTPYTRYKIKVKPVMLNAESQFSEPVLNLTLEDVPSEPRNLRVVNKSASTLLIQWEKPAQENGLIRHYEVSVNGDNRKIIDSVKDKVLYEENLTNLTARTVYTIQVKACAKECSRAVIRNDTEIGQPGVVPKPSANWDNFSLVIRWDKPAPINLEVDYFEIMVGTNNKEVEIFNVTDQTFLVSICGKDKSQNVYVVIRAVNILAGRALKGPWSERADFPCFRSASSELWVIIIIVVSIIIFMTLMVYLVKQLWVHIQLMRHITVKLPDGLVAVVESYQEKEKHIDDTLPADVPLLSNFPSQPRNPSGQSSGCCSGTESVSSSVESAGHLSISDSGTEQPRSPSLGGDTEGNVALRQRVTNVKKSDYVTMPEIAQTSWSPKQTQGGYSVIGLAAPPKKPEVDHEYMALSDTPTKPSYVPFKVPQTQEPIKEPPVKPPPSGYVPYMAQEPAAKNTDYVLAGVPTKPSLVLPKAPSFTQKEETSSGYVKAPPTSMEAPKLLIPWQQQSSVEPPSTGYVVVGDPKPQKGPLDVQKGSKGYVPHNIKFDTTTKSLKED